MELHSRFACSMPRDPRLIAAGPLARLVYMEAAMYCRENLTDGKIDRTSLVYFTADLSVAVKVKHLTKLAEVGALQTTEHGWRIPPKVWRKWNPTRQTVEAAREIAAEAGVRGNHERWHLPPEGKPSPKCPICISDRVSVGVPDREAIGWGSLKPQPQPQPKPQPEPEPEPEPKPEPSSSSSSKLTLVVPPPTEDEDEDDFETTVTAIADLRYRTERARTDRDPIARPSAWKQTAAHDARTEHGPRIRHWLTDGHTPTDIAIRIETGTWPERNEGFA